MTRLQADLCLLVAAAIWGLSFIAQKSAMQHLDPLAFIAVRSIIACAALLPLALLESRRASPDAAPTAELLRLAPFAGLLFFVGATFQQFGIVTASVTNTSFLTVLYTVFTPLITWVVLRQAPVFLVWPAVILSFAGTWLLGGGAAASGSGDALVVISAFFWAAHVVLTGVSSRLDRPFAFNMLQFGVVAALALVAAVATGAIFDPAAVRAALPELLFVGVLSSAVTFTLFTMALRHTPPSEAAILVSSETVFASLAAYWLLDERLDQLGWIGAALILAATLMVRLAPTAEARRRRTEAAILGPGPGH